MIDENLPEYHLHFFFSGAEGNFTWVEMIQRDRSK